LERTIIIPDQIQRDEKRYNSEVTEESTASLNLPVSLTESTVSLREGRYPTRKRLGRFRVFCSRGWFGFEAYPLPSSRLGSSSLSVSIFLGYLVGTL
jgi:hypothetical protein